MPVLLNSDIRDGSLRQVAADRGIPILLYEAGEALRFDEDAISVGVRGVRRVLAALGMVAFEGATNPQPTLEIQQTRWIRAARSGIVRTVVRVGELVEENQVLATISDAFGSRAYKIKAPFDGVVIGQTRNPLINRGDGLFHLAMLRPERKSSD